MDKKLQPRLRFSGFTDAWEQRPLGSLINFINGRAFAQSELLSVGKYRVLRVGNFYSNDSWYYSDLELDDKYYVNDGDLLYTWSATFGPHLWTGEKAIYHYHIWKLELSSCLDKQFTKQLLEFDLNSSISDEHGSTMIHVTKKGMEEKNVAIPTSISEQKAIGQFLEKLDQLIELNQRKLELLKLKKKAYLQKIFSQKLRFKGFTEPWEQHIIGSLLRESVAQNPVGEILSVSVSRGIYPASESDRESDPGASLAKYKVVKRGDVVYNSMRLWQGAIGYSDYDGIVSPAYVVMRPVEDADSYFLAILLRLPAYLAEYYRLSQGNSKDTLSLKYEEFSRISVAQPAAPERRRIDAFFATIDKLIILNRQKIEMLQRKKQAYLQQMFV